MSSRKSLMALVALAAGLAVGMASAKLPAPSEEAKAKAAEAKVKAGEAAKKEAEMLGKYQDRAAENYKNRRGGITKTSAPAPKK